MFTVLVYLIEAKTGYKAGDLYLGTFILDILVLGLFA